MLRKISGLVSHWIKILLISQDKTKYMNIQENISLKSLNTFGIAKNARFFIVADNIHVLMEALIWAKEKNQQVLILGGGSNILLTGDYEGLVIKIEIKGIALLKEDEEHVWIKVGAGEIWHDLVLYAIEKNWAGLENLSLIPGTVGASPMQNIGAYGVELKEVFESLEALNRSTFTIETFSGNACEFGYRESVFKHKFKNQYVICSVVFKLSKTPAYKVEYGAIQDILKEKGVNQLSIRDISNAVIAIRSSKLPDPKEIGNAGSFFKNPTIGTDQYSELRSIFPDIPGYPVENGVKVPAGWLIEQTGWKGKRIGEVGVHAKQALVLVNYGEGQGTDIIELSDQVRHSVREKFGIELQPEVNFI
ncbi:UDP-N-acetylmuramate dehydrogenase [Algoriphagus sp.]|uniref:UDP-N-acetylmuramate dehydrogenase n=1 Tax=Algoriphagus sp. TaxID=1872435 RepID=UPI00391A061F